MRLSFTRVVPAAILACAAVACSSGQDVHDAEDTGIADAIVDSVIDTSVDVPVDSSTEVSVDSGTADTTVTEDSADVDAPPPAACPGTALTLSGTGSAPRVASVVGNTSSGASSSTVASSCGGGSSPELVYTFTSDTLGTATVQVAAGYPAVLAARSTCDDSSTERACETRSSPGDTKLEFLVAAGGTYSVIVDGVGGTSGPFALDLSIAPSTCGNGHAESVEECDDGNTASGDGCSGTCALESTGKVDQCPGLGYTFSGATTSPRTISLRGDTSTITGSSLSSSSCTATNSSNAIYGITPDVDGSLTLELTAKYPSSALYVRRECAQQGQEADCAQTAAALAPTKLTIPVRKSATVWAVVDGTGKGAFLLDATLSPASCGNKIIDGGEDCDDGNTTAGDGCTATCKAEPLTGERCASADAITLTAQTDGSYTGTRAGSTIGMADDFPGCSATPGQGDAVFRVDVPVDGFLTATVDPTFYAAVELRKACKDGAAGSDRVGTCQRSIGTLPTIVSGPVRAGSSYWVIVDGNGITPNTAGYFGLDVKVSPAVCGNGVIEGAETCDDGGTDPDDGCSATCTLETMGAGSTCANPKVITTADDGSGIYRGTLKFGTTNLNATGNLGTGCTSQGKEAYLSITAPMDGVLKADITSATFDVTLGARSPCSTSGDTNKITCANKTTELGNEHIAFAVESGKTYFVVVDGAKSTDFGKFSLDVAIAPPKCGDSVLAGGEGCDDGNTTAGDGCSATCTLETLTGLSACPGYAINLTGTGSTPRRVSRTLSTATLSGTTSGTCGGSGRDGTIAVTSDVSGVLRAQLTAPWSTVLYARSTCADASTELACNADNPASSADVVRDISFSVVAGVPVYLVVDGLLGDSGTATLDISVTP